MILNTGSVFFPLEILAVVAVITIFATSIPALRFLKKIIKNDSKETHRKSLIAIIMQTGKRGSGNKTDIKGTSIAAWCP